MAIAALAGACGASGPPRIDVTPRATTSTTYPRGPANSPYWVAGWLPAGARLQRAYSWTAHRKPGQPIADIEYGKSEEDIAVQMTMLSASDVDHELHNCGRFGGPARPATVRGGKRACAGPDSDEGNEFGWVITWRERADVGLQVIVHDPETVPEARVIAGRVANGLYPVSAATWSRLVTMTNRFIDPNDPRNWVRAHAASGHVGGHEWTLTAMVPRDFPLGSDDYRPTCVELDYGGDIRRTCSSDPGDGEFQRMHGHVFAFGLVPPSAVDLELERQDRGHGEHGVVATLQSSTASDTTWRFFAAPLLADNCGVIVYDTTGGRHQQVAFAPSLPSDGVPCNHPLPYPRAVPTTAPH